MFHHHNQSQQQQSQSSNNSNNDSNQQPKPHQQQLLQTLQLHHNHHNQQQQQSHHQHLHNHQNHPPPQQQLTQLTTNDDLKAFERRLTEIIACYQPATKRWRILLFIVILTTSLSAFHWYNDPSTNKVSIIQSLYNHLYFSLNCIVLILLFIFGIHKRIVAPRIIVTRIRLVLENFNMSCDQKGRLILKRL